MWPSARHAPSTVEFRNTTMQLRSRARPSHHEAQDERKSAARLAAEAAFSTVAQPRPPAGQPRVVVRKARGLVPTPGPSEPLVAAAAPGESGDRGSRVFRVETARQPDAAPPAEALAAAAGVDALAPTRPRRRRATADKQPGPVLQVFSATARYEPLRVALAGLEPVFASIRQAQSQPLTDDTHADAWQRLSQGAGEIGKQIAAALAAA